MAVEAALARCFVVIVFAALGFAACGRADRQADTAAPADIGPRGDAGVPVTDSPPAPRGTASGPAGTGPEADSAGAQANTWDLGFVQARLADVGLRVERTGESVRQPFMSAPGVPLRVTAGRSSAEVQAFFYGDANARARDTDRLDPKRVAPPTMMVTWTAPASLVVDNNLAAIVLTRDESLRDRIRHALTAQRERESRSE